MIITKESFYSKLIHYMALLVFAGLFLVGIAVTGWNHWVYDEYPSLEMNNYFGVFLGLLFVWFLFKGLSKLYDKFLVKVNPAVITGIFAVLVYVVSAIWIICAQAVPQADQLTVYNLANEINEGMTAKFEETSYLVFFPYQLGFVSFLRVLIKLFGYGNYTPVYLVLALNVPLIVVSGSGIIKHILGEDKAGKTRFIFCMIMFLCIPVYIYTTFIYGDLPFAALSLACIWCMYACFDKPNPGRFILFFVLCGINYLCKTNALIIFMAIGIYLVISLISKEKRPVSVGLLAAMILGLFVFNAGNQKLYSDVMPEDEDSLPFIASVVMGMNDDYSNAGWCNFYHQNVFMENDCDAEITKLACKDDLKATLGYWVKHPLYTVDFFYRKINLQWNTPFYQALCMNSTHIADDQPALGRLIYENEAVHLGLQKFMKAFQISAYGYMTLALLVTRKKDRNLKGYVPVIAVFGSFLFSLMWESKTRYQMPAYVILMLCFAIAAVYLQEWVKGCKEERIEKVFSVKAPIKADCEFAKSDENEFGEAVEGIDRKNHNGIDLFKFIMALAVVAIHVIPHINLSGTFGFTAVTYLIDCAVPFFFMAAGFLLGEKMMRILDNKGKCKIALTYALKMTKMYLLWSVIYLPINIIYYVKNRMQPGYCVWDYVRRLLFVGDNYNSYILWYLLSSIYGALIIALMIKKNIKERTWIAVSLGLISLSLGLTFISEYSDANGFYGAVTQVLSYTTSNGRVFMGAGIISLGIYFTTKKNKLIPGLLTFVCGFLMSISGIFGGIGVIVTAIGLFIISESLVLPDSDIWKWLRRLSQGLYFTHLLVWSVYYTVRFGEKTFGPETYLWVTGISIVLSLAYFSVKDKISERKKKASTENN